VFENGSLAHRFHSMWATDVALVTDWNTFSIMHRLSVAWPSVEVLKKALYRSKDVQHAGVCGSLL
jgi:hypothetical protein